MNKQFASFIHNFIKQYKTDIFNDMSKCKSLLLDHAKGEYKNEIRLLLQALDMGCYTTIMNSNDLNMTRISLIKQLQDEYYISESIAISLIDMLLIELKNYKVEQIKQVTKTKPEKKITTQKNVSNQSQSVQLPSSATNKANNDINALRDIISIMSTKENYQKFQIEKYNYIVKSVYEPAFKEYKEIMKKNNLECEYAILEHNAIYFCFLFVAHLSYYPMYGIEPYSERTVTVRKVIPRNLEYRPVRESNTKFAFLGINHARKFQQWNMYDVNIKKNYKIENFSKEIIMEGLKDIENRILSKIKGQSTPKQEASKQKPINNNSRTKNDSFSSNVKDLFSYIDNLLDYVYKDEIEEYDLTEHYDKCKKLLRGIQNNPNIQRSQLKYLVEYLGQILAKLPDEKIEEFANSEHYETYKRLFRDLGIV
jgi:hypothetical protein